VTETVRTSLRVTALELPARWGRPERALREVDEALAAGPPTDLVLLPEAALTGYVSPSGDFDLRRFAEPLDGPMAAGIAELARRHRVHLGGPLIERDGLRHHNTLLLFDPDGQLVLHYRKRHPWYPETWADPGDVLPPPRVVRGRKVTAAICFDVHFLVEEAAALLGAADVLLFPSAWVEETDSRPELLSGLARRFGIAIVNANWGWGRPRIAGQGGSRIVGPDGSVLAVAEAGRADAELEQPGT
jgi:predicted amidohydrolase